MEVSDHKASDEDKKSPEPILRAILKMMQWGIPDQQEVNWDVADLLTKDDKIEKADNLLEDICQTFFTKKDIASPLSQCSEKINDEKLQSIKSVLFSKTNTCHPLEGAARCN